MSEESTTDLVEPWIVSGLWVAPTLTRVMSFYATDAVWEPTGLGANFEGEAAILRDLDGGVGDVAG